MEKATKARWLKGSDFSYIGIFLVVAILVGYFVGCWVDAKFHTTPWLAILGFALGVASWASELLRLVKRQRNKQARASG